ncbi:hypothetical protein [Streptomyces sp. TP-A0356]|uniref:hypothetical protein n=1 Tax=Streptomyces sp. TP-A0356 TaxID=1359208 RepID=UPI0006E1390B|nr:hypothetical protein [Streptomyces sp. TP-A0356]
MDADNNEPISREAFARVWGAGMALLGMVTTILAFVLPAKLTGLVRDCNTVAGDISGRQHPVTGLKCTAASYVTDYKWVFVALGVLLLVGGVVLFAGASIRWIREEFDIE